MYFVTILWGENPSKYEEPEQYYFNTEQEREKFKHEEFDNYKGEE